MDVLSNLIPRQAGDRIVEPRVTFDVVEQPLHATDRCASTCAFSGEHCLVTGTSTLP